MPTARVDPNRKWFGNTRVIAQDALSHFREAMGDKKNDSYQVLLRRNKLPMSLLDEKDQTESPTLKILETETYEQVFGPKQQRKKRRYLAVSNLEELAQLTEEDSKTYEEKQELDSTLGLMGGSILDRTRMTSPKRLRKPFSTRVNLKESGMNYIRLLILRTWLFMYWMLGIH